MYRKRRKSFLGGRFEIEMLFKALFVMGYVECFRENFIVKVEDMSICAYPEGPRLPRKWILVLLNDRIRMLFKPEVQREEIRNQEEDKSSN